MVKKYGKVTAVDGVSLTVKKSEIYGFLGLNGAGKTTTIRMLLGMIRPSGGESYLKGTRVHARRRYPWNSVGYLVEVPYSYPDLTVRENLDIIRRLRRMNGPGAVDAVMEKMSLGPYRDRIAKHLSLGNAQRLGLAKAIMHNPDILILDEPANGLDPAGIVEIREMLLNLSRNKGVTVFISSHILGEISRFATRIGIIHQGRLLQELDAGRLNEARKKRLLINLRDKQNAAAVLAKNGFSTVFTEQGLLEVSGRAAADNSEQINALLVHAGYVPSKVNVEEEDLESFFLRVIGMQGGAA